ncbi:MAG: hypothetical protein ACRELY_22580 [Polyangiaceae bacterium]
MITRHRIANDQRGAVMVMGLFMALAFIGMLWFLLGVGSTLAFKEKMQQAADSAAFSAAVVHARDMNLIVAINMVMFVIVGAWLILCVTYTIMEIVSIYMWIAAAVSCIVGCELAPAAEGTEDLKDAIAEAKQGYEDVLDELLPALSMVQDSVGMFTDDKAGLLTIGATLTNQDAIFGGAASADVTNPAAFAQVGKRIGLPVESEKNADLCGDVANWVMGYAQTLLEKNPIVKRLMNMSPAEKIAMKIAFSKFVTANPLAGMGIDSFQTLLDKVREMIASGLKIAYCSGGVCEKAGPKRLYRSDPKKPSQMEKNASDWMQVYGVMVPTSGIDDNDAEHKIGLASRTHQVHTDPSILASFSYAEAEYYFDCSGKWAGGDCNAISDEVKDTGIDASMYRLEWRSRLVRAHTPKNLPGGTIISAVNSILTSRAIVKQLEDSGPLAAPVREAMSTLPPSVLDFINAVPAASFH